MPFCSQCGNHVGDEDAFCALCGNRQPTAGARALPTAAPVFQQVDFLERMPARTFALLCYVPVLGCVPAIVALGMKRFRGDFTMRFHAFQGLYIFAAWLVVHEAVGPVFGGLHHVFGLVQALLMFVWIFMLVKTSRGQTYELPFIGELAQRSAREKT